MEESEIVPCPGGALENSPAIHRWVDGSRCLGGPVGTLETSHSWFNCPYGTRRIAVNWHPSDESLGYGQTSLRDEIAVRTLWDKTPSA